MAASRKKAKADTSAQAKLTGYGSAIYAGLRSIGIAFFSLSVHSYFLWSSLLFVGCGIALTIGYPGVKGFLCHKPAQAPAGGPGCVNCRAELLMCPKDLCYRSAVNVTWYKSARTPAGSLYQAFMEAATDLTCNSLLDKKANNPVEMIVAINGLVAPEAVTSGCTSFHCRVLRNAVGEISDLDSATGQCTDEYGAKSGASPSSCVCDSLLPSITTEQHTAIENVCGTFLSRKCPWGSFMPSWCGVTPAPTPVSTPAANTPAPSGNGSSTSGGSTIRLLSAMPAALAPVPGAARPPVALGEVLGGCGEAGSGVGANGTAALAMAARRLQSAPAPTPSAAAELNKDLQDYTVGKWSKCTCYQQCLEGVKTRLVQCLAAACKSPEPPTKERCTCKHCAACSVVMRMFILSIMFFSQAGIAFILFLCYLQASGTKEESLIKISILRKLMGMFCKNLPPLVRLLVLTNVTFIGLIVAQTYVPKLVGLAWQRDCFDSGQLRLISLIVAGMSVFQLLLGRCAKRMTRKPPWLFVPDRVSWPTPFRQIRFLFRSLGP